MILHDLRTSAHGGNTACESAAPSGGCVVPHTSSPAGDERMAIAIVLAIAAITVVVVAGRRRMAAKEGGLRL